MEAYGPAKYEEALRQVHAMAIGEHAIWREEVAADNLRKAEKTGAATERATERAAELERERRAATIAGLAPWGAKYAAANPMALSTPSSHMVSRGLVQAVLKKLSELEPSMRGLVGTAWVGHQSCWTTPPDREPQTAPKEISTGPVSG
jgi:hypothetical protein